MSTQVQELIDKIKTEGVQAADQKAKEIEGSAKNDAQKMIHDAKAQAQQIIEDANKKARQITDSTQTALKQAARDTLISLRKEIERTLNKVIAQKVNDSLTPERLADIIAAVVKKSAETEMAQDDILITLSEADLKNLKDGFTAKLQKEVQKTVKLQSHEDMGKGFTISYDNGKSCFDFSDTSLAEYLSTYVNAQVAALIREA